MFPKAERVAVVGSGPSLRDIAPNEIVRCGATVIAVNGAIDWLGSGELLVHVGPVAGEHGSDAQPRRGLPVRGLWPHPIPHVGQTTGPHYWRPVGQGSGAGGLSEDPAAINTGNSGFGALGLAYHMRPMRIALLGIDGRQERRVDGGCPGHWSTCPRCLRPLCRS